jgi:hypothetical protein
MTVLEYALAFCALASSIVSAVSLYKYDRRVRYIESLVHDVHSGAGAQTQTERRQRTLAELAEQACAFVDEQAAARSKRNQPAWTWQDKQHSAVDWFEHAARMHALVTDRGEIERYIGAHLGQRRRRA